MQLGSDLPAAVTLVEQGVLTTDALVEVATQALIDGLDSPSLRMLAGVRLADAPYEARQLAVDALDELALTASSADGARRVLACAIVRQILHGDITEFRGSRQFWFTFSGTQHYPDFAGELMGLEDESEGGWGRTEAALRAEVREVASEVLDAWGDPTSASHRFQSHVRRWLLAEHDRWSAAYAEVQRQGDWRVSDPSGKWHYSEAAEMIVPRYRLADALLGEVERLRPAKLTDDEVRRAVVACADAASVAHWLRYPAAVEELDAFLVEARGVTVADLSPTLLPYRRTLTETDERRRRAALAERWGSDRTWHPLLRAEVPADVLILQAAVWSSDEALTALRAALAECGVTVVVSLNEDRSCEIATEAFDPSYGRDGEILATSRFPWFLIYTSHEGTTAFSPGPHVDVFRRIFNVDPWLWPTDQTRA